MDLTWTGEGVGPKQDFFAEEKSVLHVAGRVVRGKIEGFEIVVVVLYLGAILTS